MAPTCCTPEHLQDVIHRCHIISFSIPKKTHTLSHGQIERPPSVLKSDCNPWSARTIYIEQNDWTLLKNKTVGEFLQTVQYAADGITLSKPFGEVEGSIDVVT